MGIFEIFGVFLVLAIIFLWYPYIMKTGKDGAPYVGMDPDVVQRVVDMAEVKPGDIFYDLGSGDGRVVVAAALRGATAYGVEIDKPRIWYSRAWIWLMRLSSRAHIIEKNIFDVDYSNATVMCLYLLQETNEKIQAKLEKELKPGTRVVSVAFDFPDWKLVKLDPRGTIYGPIHLYKI